MKLKIFSFFAGAGFLDLGFETAGYEVVFANEFHQPFLEAYLACSPMFEFRASAFWLFWRVDHGFPQRLEQAESATFISARSEG